MASQEPDDSRRAVYGAIVLIFADLTDRVELWRTGLEGWNMRESTIVAEWKAEGRAEGKREDLLRLLELKFRATVPPDLVSTVENQSNPDILTNWFDSAVLADSLEAFRKAIAG